MTISRSAAAAAVEQWIHDFVIRPHPRLGRDGQVCPFVEPAMRQHTLPLRERAIGPDPSLEALREELRMCVKEFHATEWPRGNRNLHAILFLFPRLTEEDAELLDEAHASIKDELVPQDIMMAPFHPRCAEPAARSPELMAFQSPVPMVAVRRLAFHDILFLHQRPDWFEHYARRFGERYRYPDALDPEYVRRYRLGVEAFGEPRPEPSDRPSTTQTEG